MTRTTSSAIPNGAAPTTTTATVRRAFAHTPSLFIQSLTFVRTVWVVVGSLQNLSRSLALDRLHTKKQSLRRVVAENLYIERARKRSRFGKFKTPLASPSVYILRDGISAATTRQFPSVRLVCVCLFECVYHQFG